MKHNTKKYRFRWRLFYRVERGWSEPFRIPFNRTWFMLDTVFSRLFLERTRWLYIVLPWIVDANDHNWREPRRA